MQRSTQAVMLVDINAISNSKKIDDSDFEKSLAALRLGTLKLLTYFLHRQIRSDEHVKWGHKFYNSMSLRSLSQKHGFQDMKIDSFEEFENDVVVRLTKERERLRKLDELKSDCNLSNDNCAAHKVEDTKTCQSSHCDSLKNALKEVLCDFQWDRPDITSPVRRSKRRTSFKSDVGEGERDNILFVISECPWTTKDLQAFLGSSSTSVNLTSNAVLSSVMTSNMRSVYCSSLKLKVFWLDTTQLSTPMFPMEETSCHNLIDEALYHLGGAIIPLSSLVQFSSSHSFPVTSIISWYLDSSRRGTPTVIAKLMVKDKENAVICDLEIAPVESKSISFRTLPCQHTYQWNVYAVGLVPRCFLPADVQLTSLLVLPVKAKKIEFFCMLQLLISQKMSLIVNVGGDTGILSPLTSTVATLEVINFHPECLDVLTSDCSYCKTSSWEQPFAKKKAKLQLFIQSSIDHFIKNQAPRNNSQSPSSADCDVAVMQQFSGHVMDSWFCNTRVHASSPDSINYRDTNRKEREASIMYKARRMFGLKSFMYDTRTTSHSEGNKLDAEQSTKMNISARATQLVSYSRATQLRRQQKQLRKELQESSCVNVAQAEVTKPKEKQQLWIDLFGNLEFSDESRFSTRLRNIYQDFLTNSLPVLNCAENIVGIVLHYTRSCGKANAEESCKELLESELYKSPTDVNDAYEVLTDPGTKNLRIREYELQTVMRLETLVAVPNECDRDKLISEAAAHLRYISFVADPAHLGEFLRDVVYNNYTSSLSDVVSEIFDELNQPLPHADGSDCSESSKNGNNMPFSLSELDGCLSDSNTADTSSVSSPVAHKRKSLQRCQSFSEVSQKRQIVVPVKSRVRTRTQKNRKPHTHSSSQLSSSVISNQTNDMKKVCRNLFHRGLCSPAKNLVPEAKEVDEQKKKRVLKTKEAPNTPFHKQVANANLQKQARLRKNTKSLTSLTRDVVEESPFKKVEEATCSITNSDPNSQLPFYPPAIQESRNVNRLKLHFRSKSESMPSSASLSFNSPDKQMQRTRVQLHSPHTAASQARTCNPSSILVSSCTRSPRTDPMMAQLEDKNTEHFSASIVAKELHLSHVMEAKVPSLELQQHSLNLEVVSSTMQSPSMRMTRSHSSQEGKKQCSIPITTQPMCKRTSRKKIPELTANASLSDSSYSTSQESLGEQRVPSEIDPPLSPELFPNSSPQCTRVSPCRKLAKLPENMVATRMTAKRSRKRLLSSLSNVGVDISHSSTSASGEQIVPFLNTGCMKRTCLQNKLSIDPPSLPASDYLLQTSKYTSKQYSSTDELPHHSDENKFNFQVETGYLTNSFSNFHPVVSSTHLKAIDPTSFVRNCSDDFGVTIPLSPASRPRCAASPAPKTGYKSELNAMCPTALVTVNTNSEAEANCFDDKNVSSNECNDDNFIVNSSPVLQGTTSPEPLTLANLSALNDLCGCTVQDNMKKSSRGSSKSVSPSFESEMSIQFTESSEKHTILNSTTTKHSKPTCSNKQPYNDDYIVNSSPRNKNKLLTQPNSGKLVQNAESQARPVTLSDYNSMLFSKFPVVRLERYNIEGCDKNYLQNFREIKSSFNHWRKVKPRYGSVHTVRGTRASNRVVAQLNDTNKSACAFQKVNCSQTISSAYLSPSRSASATPSKSATPRTLSRKRHFSTGEIDDKTETTIALDSDYIPIQRFTRHQSKEIGISAEEFKMICTKTPEKISKLVRDLDQGQMPIKRPCLELSYSGDSEEEVFFSEKKFQKDSLLDTAKLGRLRARHWCMS